MSEKQLKDSAVRIAVRIRPIDDVENDERCVKQSDQDPNVLIVSDERAFPYDIVFGETSTQEDVYYKLLKDQTEKLINGFNCASLAYGQTGTGKTYSMGLQDETFGNEQSGIVHRVLGDVFKGAEEKFGENGWTVSVSFIEIYNEKVYDLFSESAGPLKNMHYKSKDIAKCEVSSVEETIQLLQFANGSRHTRSTPLNSNSSRSHAIFTVRLSVKVKNTTTDSALHLVDLAGSEGVKRTGHQGIALSEGNHINQGLLAVGKVLQAMAGGNKVVPYRDSVLTQVLQEALSLNSFITLLACISPSASNVNETLSTLRFAHNVKQLKTTPQINHIVNELKKGKTPNKYGAPLRSIQNNRNATPSRRPFSMVGVSTIKKQQSHFQNNTICTPSKRQRIDFEPLNSTTFGVPSEPVLSVEEFFHPDNFRNAIGSEHRESVSSIVSGINISASTEIEQPPSIRASCSNVMSTPVQTVSISPLLRRITSLESALTDKFEKFQETMTQNQTSFAPTSTPMARSNQTVSDVGMDEIRKELQMIVRQELFSFVAQLPQNVTQNPLATTRYANDALDSLCIPDEPMTPGCFLRPQTNVALVHPIRNVMTSNDIVIHLDETSQQPEEALFRAPEPLMDRSTATRRSSRRTRVPNDAPVRRSARLSSAPPRPEPTPAEPAPKRNRSTSRRRDAAPTQNKQIASYFKSRESIDPNVAKSKHIAAVFELLNTGSIKELQILPKIGHKTAYQIVTTRIMKGRYKTLKDIGKLPIWRGKQWNTFLEANHLK